MKKKLKDNGFIFLKINPESSLKKSKPDLIILFVWNLTEEIKKQLNYTKKWKANMYTFYPKIRKVF